MPLPAMRAASCRNWRTEPRISATFSAFAGIIVDGMLKIKRRWPQKDARRRVVGQLREGLIRCCGPHL